MWNSGAAGGVNIFKELGVKQIGINTLAHYRTVDYKKKLKRKLTHFIEDY